MKSPDIVTLDSSVGIELRDHALDAAAGLGDLLESEESIKQAHGIGAAIAQQFPAEVTESFAHFMKHGNAKGALVLRGLMPPEEIQTAMPDKQGYLPTTRAAKAAGLLAIAASTLTGSPMSYTSNPRGHVRSFITQVSPLQHVSPSGALRTGESIGWHAEAAGSPDEHTIEFLSLYCVRGQKNVATKIMPGDILDRAFSQREQIALRKYQYTLSETILPNSGHFKRPIVRDTPRGAAISYADFYMDEPATSDDAFTAATLGTVRNKISGLEDRITVHELQTGDVLAIDNHGLHSRDQFEPTMYPRWQMRMFVGKPGVPLFVDPSLKV